VENVTNKTRFLHCPCKDSIAVCNVGYFMIISMKSVQHRAQKTSLCQHVSKGESRRGRLGQSPPLKPKKVTLFSIILYNLENKIRDIKPLRRLLFCHNSFVKHISSL